MYSDVSEGKSFREQLSEERKEWWRVGKLRGAVIAYLCSKWYRNEGRRRVDVMADTVPEGLEIDPKDWLEAREFLLDIKDRDLSAFYPENSDKVKRLRTPVASNKSQRMEIPGKIKLDPEMKNPSAEQKLGFLPEATKPAILDEIDDLDLFVKRRLKYKAAEGKQDCRLTQTPSPNDRRSTSAFKNEIGKNETYATDREQKAEHTGSMASKMASKVASQVNPRSVIHAGTTYKHACSEVYVDARKHQDNRTVNAGQLTGPKTELDWTQDGCQMDQCKPHTERSMPEKGHFNGLDSNLIETPDEMKYKFEHGEAASCSGYQPSFASTKSTISKKTDSRGFKKTCSVDTLTVARKMKEFLPPCKLTDGDELLSGGEGGKIETGRKGVEEGQKVEHSFNSTGNKGRETSVPHERDLPGEKKKRDCITEDREGPKSLSPEDWKAKREVKTEQTHEIPRVTIQREEPVIRTQYRPLVKSESQSSSTVNVDNPRYKLHRTFRSGRVVPLPNIVPGCRRPHGRERPLSVRKKERAPEVREAERESVEPPSPAPTPVKRVSFRGRCARYVRNKLESFRQTVRSLNCLAK